MSMYLMLYSQYVQRTADSSLFSLDLLLDMIDITCGLLTVVATAAEPLLPPSLPTVTPL